LSMIIIPSSVNDVMQSTEPVLIAISGGGLAMQPNSISVIFFVLIFVKNGWYHVAIWSVAN